jgi:hypothetical protein
MIRETFPNDSFHLFSRKLRVAESGVDAGFGTFWTKCRGVRDLRAVANLGDGGCISLLVKDFVYVDASDVWQPEGNTTVYGATLTRLKSASDTSKRNNRLAYINLNRLIRLLSLGLARFGRHGVRQRWSGPCSFQTELYKGAGQRMESRAQKRREAN